MAIPLHHLSQSQRPQLRKDQKGPSQVLLASNSRSIEERREKHVSMLRKRQGSKLNLYMLGDI